VARLISAETDSVLSVDRAMFVDEHPRLFYMAEDSSWPGNTACFPPAQSSICTTQSTTSATPSCLAFVDAASR
jgi:hypothetical protein